MAKPKSKTNKAENKKLGRILKVVSVGQVEPRVSLATVPGEGKTFSLWFDFGFPEGISDRMDTGEENKTKLDAFFEAKEAEARERLEGLGAEVRKALRILTQDFPPAHLTRLPKPGEPEEAVRFTPEEIQKHLEDLKKDGSPGALMCARWIEADLRKVEEGYFVWVGGSLFEGECWQPVRYCGLRLIVEGFVSYPTYKRLVA